MPTWGERCKRLIGETPVKGRGWGNRGKWRQPSDHTAGLKPVRGEERKVNSKELQHGSEKNLTQDWFVWWQRVSPWWRHRSFQTSLPVTGKPINNYLRTKHHCENLMMAKNMVNLTEGVPKSTWQCFEIWLRYLGSFRRYKSWNQYHYHRNTWETNQILSLYISSR